jgi:hypothetical protein
MDTLAASLRRLASTAPAQPLPIANQTGLDGTWDIDLKWDLKVVQVTANMSTSSNELIFDAIGKIGLKLDHGDVPQPVLSIMKATQQPTPNAANIATLLPPLVEPRFEVASVRACAPNSGNGRVRATVGPGGNRHRQLHTDFRPDRPSLGAEADRPTGGAAGWLGQSAAPPPARDHG